MLTFTLSCDYAQLAEIERMTGRFHGQLLQTEFLACVSLTLALPHAQVAGFSQNLTDFSRGALTLTPLD
jgi:putative IMPACT (imprinted ancient) family translation regulator